MYYYNVMNHFQYNFSSSSGQNYGWITLDKINIYQIANADEFYSALGFTDEMRQAGVLAEEFMWTEYRKDNSEKAEVCLQIKIIEYLKTHSATFNEKYATECEDWIASCEKLFLSNTPMCADCNENKYK